MVCGTSSSTGYCSLYFLPKDEKINAEKYDNLWISHFSIKMEQQSILPEVSLNSIQLLAGNSTDLNLIENSFDYIKEQVPGIGEKVYEPARSHQHH